MVENLDVHAIDRRRHLPGRAGGAERRRDQIVAADGHRAAVSTPCRRRLGERTAVIATQHRHAPDYARDAVTG